MSGLTSYYSFNKLLSYNGVFNFCVGGRGLGKTYGAKKKVIKDSLRTGVATDFLETDQFIYLRRYKEELQMSKDTFFADISHEFPDWDFRVNAHLAQTSHASERDTKQRKWHTIGYFIPLSVAQKFKSVAFPLVKKIIFDEFIIEKGVTQYLPNEAHAFTNFYSTVDRWKDKTKVLFLANSVLITNPYFIHYKIDPNACDEDGFIKLNNNFIIVHFPDSEQFKNEVYQTRFGQFIEDTDYADYAVGNQFSDNHQHLIKYKTSKARYLFTLEGKGGQISVWYDMRLNEYFCMSKRPKVEVNFTLLEEKMNEDKTLMNFADKPLSMLRTAFKHAQVSFDSPQTRNTFLEIFKR